jgi:hypothetical protein
LLGYTYKKLYGPFSGKRHPYERIIYHLQIIYSFDAFMEKIYDNKLIYTFLNFIHGNTAGLQRYRTLRLIIKKIPLSFLIILFLYDCYFNSYVITKIFYYLPFYLVYTIWYNLTMFLCNNDAILDRIIYERYYEENNVVYVATTIEQDEYILKYIRGNFKAFWIDFKYVSFTEYNNKMDIFTTYANLIIYSCRYVRDTKNMAEEIYYHPYTGKEYLRDRSSDIDLD